MDYLSIDVPILERTNTILIEIPYGFENEIYFNITDSEITETTAILYIEQPTGLPLTSICTVSGRTVLYKPKPNDFFPGNNICQIRVGKDLSMNIVVRCHRGAYIPSIDITDGSLANEVIAKCDDVIQSFGTADISSIADGTIKGSILFLSKKNSEYKEYSYDDGYCDDGNQLLSDVIKIEKSGVYIIWTIAKIGTTSSNGIFEIAINAGGKSFPVSVLKNAGLNLTGSGCIMVKLNNGDSVYQRCFQNGGYRENITERKLKILYLCEV